MASIVDSLVAPLSVINALIVALCMKKQKEVAKTLTMLEDIWDEYQLSLFSPRCLFSFNMLSNYNAFFLCRQLFLTRFAKK